MCERPEANPGPPIKTTSGLPPHRPAPWRTTAHELTPAVVEAAARRTPRTRTPRTRSPEATPTPARTPAAAAPATAPASSAPATPATPSAPVTPSAPASPATAAAATAHFDGSGRGEGCLDVAEPRAQAGLRRGARQCGSAGKHRCCGGRSHRRQKGSSMHREHLLTFEMPPPDARLAHSAGTAQRQST